MATPAEAKLSAALSGVISHFLGLGFCLDPNVCSSQLSAEFLFSETAGADRDRCITGLNPSSAGDAWLGRVLPLSRQRFFRILRACERERAFSPSSRLTHIHVYLAVSLCSAWEPWHADGAGALILLLSPALDQQHDSFWLKTRFCTVCRPAPADASPNL